MTISYAVEQVLKEVLAEQSATSQHTYRWLAKCALAKWGEDRNLTDITRKEVQAWVNDRRSQVSAATIRHELAFFNRLYRIAEDEGLEIECPNFKIRKPRLNNRRTEILTLEHMSMLKRNMDPWDYSICEFAKQTFLRRLEIWKLRPAHITLKQVGNQKHPQSGQVIPLFVGVANIQTSKTGVGRQCALNHIASAIVQRWMRRDTPYIFAPDTSNRLSAASAWQTSTWRPALAKIGLAGMDFHGLRHLGATLAMENGAKIQEVSRQLGHSSIQQTERYLHLKEREMWPAALAVARA